MHTHLTDALASMSLPVGILGNKLTPSSGQSCMTPLTFPYGILCPFWVHYGRLSRILGRVKDLSCNWVKIYRLAAKTPAVSQQRSGHSAHGPGTLCQWDVFAGHLAAAPQIRCAFALAVALSDRWSLPGRGFGPTRELLSRRRYVSSRNI